MQEYKKLKPFAHGLFTGLVEVWKDIEGYEGSYQVSSFGRVKSLARTRISKGGCIAPMKERIMALKIGRNGYVSIGFHSQGKRFFTVHRLVAAAFIPNPENKPTVNHIDGNKKNNNVSNLEWSTHSEQSLHAHANNLAPLTGSPKFSKVYKQEVYDYKLNNPEVSIVKISELFGMSTTTVGKIINEGVSPRPTTRVLKSGEHIIESILSKEDVAEIKRLRAEGWTFKRLGEKFNRGLSHMHRIVNNLSRTTEIE